MIEQLIPGHSYSLRLSCSNIAGQSDPSPVTQIKTPAVAPASCHPPRLSGKPKANSLHLRWSKNIIYSIDDPSELSIDHYFVLKHIQIMMVAHRSMNLKFK